MSNSKPRSSGGRLLLCLQGKRHCTPLSLNWPTLLKAPALPAWRSSTMRATSALCMASLSLRSAGVSDPASPLQSCQTRHSLKATSRASSLMGLSQGLPTACQGAQRFNAPEFSGERPAGVPLRSPKGSSSQAVQSFRAMLAALGIAGPTPPGPGRGGCV